MGRIDSEAQFVASAESLASCPRWSRVEVAIVGRSNVGKSSLLNALTGRRGLARVSKTPGRTQALNFFTIGPTLALVDLPGYGYARMPAARAEKLAKVTREYLGRRSNLAAILLLVDARRGPREEEYALTESARARGLRTIVVLTKCDKLKTRDRRKAIEQTAPLSEELPLLCSAKTGEGIEKIASVLRQISR